MKKTHQLQRFLKGASPTILSGIAAIGVVATFIMAVKATPKAMIRSNAAAEEKGEELTTLEVVQAVWPAYIPAAAIGLSTIVCIFGANILNKRKQASLVSAYAMLEKSYRQYRKAAKTVYGEDADTQITAQMAKDMYIYADGYGTYSPDCDQESEKILCYDPYSLRHFTTTMSAVLNAEYHLNRNLALRGCVCVNEFYEFLGIDPIEHGDCFGWDYWGLVDDGIAWLDFENRNVTMNDGRPCCVISPVWGPMPLGAD